jgi:hypothetical protein
MVTHVFATIVTARNRAPGTIVVEGRSPWEVRQAWSGTTRKTGAEPCSRSHQLRTRRSSRARSSAGSTSWAQIDNQESID